MNYRRLVVSVSLTCLLFSVIGLTFYLHQPDRTLAFDESAPGRNSRPSELSKFDVWMEDSPGNTETGIELARARRSVMEKLIRNDPARAIEAAVTLTEYKHLPAAVREFVEIPFSTTADVDVLIACGLEGSETTYVTEFPESGNMETFVYGNRREMMSRENTPVQGIRLGSVGVLRQEIFQPLEGDDLVCALDMFPVHRPAAGEAAVAALAGGRIFYFNSEDALNEANQRLAGIDSMPGPDSGAALLFGNLETLMLEDGSIDFQALEQMAQQATTAWTGTPRYMYVMLIDFPDLPGAPTDAAAIEQTITNTVSQQIWEMSYEKSHIICTVNPTVYRMPLSTNAYDNSSLYNAAMSALASDGISTSPYHTVCVCHKGPGSYGGLASVGGKKMWLKSFGSGVIVHELGHNYGTGHASFWEVAGADPVDPAGANVEYGDFTDIMGGGRVSAGHFNLWHKKNINWFENSNWTTVTGSGQFRIYRSDHRETSGLLRGLEIYKGSDGQYWVGYKQNYDGTYENFTKGAYIVWRQSGLNKTHLIDTTPQSADGKYDSGLAIGRTFSDPDAGVYITPVARGGETPDEWLDVVVNLGTDPANDPPVATMTGPTNVGARSHIEFIVSAMDPDGDQLAYAWDIGDGYVKTNHLALSYAQLAGGTVTVSCVVSDMKGGTDTVSKTVVFSDPLTEWTRRNSGTTEELTDIVIVGDEILVTGAQGGIFRSADGVDWTATDLGANRQIFGVIHDGVRYIGAGVDYDFGGPGWEAAIFTSTDGSSWTRRFDGGALGLGKLHDIAQGNGVMVAVGANGGILRSTDGINWSVSTSGTAETISGVAYGENTFVAVGGLPLALISEDGISWTDRSSGVDLDSWKGLTDVEYCLDRFLASGWYSGILQSDDRGLSFTPASTDGRQIITGFVRGRGVSFGVGVDRDDNPDSDVNMFSLDGLQWSQMLAPDQDDRNALAVYKDTFITVGRNGSIWQSGSIPLPDLGFSIWQQNNAEALGTASGPYDDADGDGILNLVEYALGTSAVDGSDRPAGSAQILPSGYLQLSIDRTRKISDIEYQVERAEGLKYSSWDSAQTAIVNDNQTNLTVRSAVPMSGQSTEFLRLTIELK